MLQTPSEVIDTQKEAMIPSESKIRRKIKAVRQEESSLTCQRVDPFVLFRPSADCIRLTHIMEGKLGAYSKPTSLNVSVLSRV